MIDDGKDQLNQKVEPKRPVNADRRTQQSAKAMGITFQASSRATHSYFLFSYVVCTAVICKEAMGGGGLWWFVVVVGSGQG
jgi:hypothetical protein